MFCKETQPFHHQRSQLVSTYPPLQAKSCTSKQLDSLDSSCHEGCCPPSGFYLKLSHGSMVAIDTIAVENGVSDNMYQRSELDYLIYNDSIGDADLIPNGDL